MQRIARTCVCLYACTVCVSCNRRICQPTSQKAHRRPPLTGKRWTHARTTAALRRAGTGGLERHANTLTLTHTQTPSHRPRQPTPAATPTHTKRTDCGTLAYVTLQLAAVPRLRLLHHNSACPSRSSARPSPPSPPRARADPALHATVDSSAQQRSLHDLFANDQKAMAVTSRQRFARWDGWAVTPRWYTLRSVSPTGTCRSCPNESSGPPERHGHPHLRRHQPARRARRVGTFLRRSSRTPASRCICTGRDVHVDDAGFAVDAQLMKRACMTSCYPHRTVQESQVALTCEFRSPWLHRRQHGASTTHAPVVSQLYTGPRTADARCEFLHMHSKSIATYPPMPMPTLALRRVDHLHRLDLFITPAVACGAILRRTANGASSELSLKRWLAQQLAQQPAQQLAQRLARRLARVLARRRRLRRLARLGHRQR